ncbi:MAG TPA: hypothetical protein VK801_12615 [Caulobacteraceae bacterium]|jgi:hypothetical protein|nr:hypothetical protein [Caulobacteraceae bacterium]
MKDTIDVRGASGTVYRFMRVRGDQPLTRMGGNFIYARMSDGTWEIVFVGEASNLMSDAHRLWPQAVQDHGAEELFTRLNVTERVRRLEQSDILGVITPPMNAEVRAN